KVRRWDRAAGPDGKECTFGFAQFEDAESLAVAVEVLKDVEVPVNKQTPAEGQADEDAALDSVEKTKLLISVDPNTVNYLGTYKESRGDEVVAGGRTDAARSALKQVVREMFFPPCRASKDADGDVSMGESAPQLGENVEVVNIPLAQEDELADIPA